MLHGGWNSLPSVITLVLSGPAWQLWSSGVLDVSLGRTEWYAEIGMEREDGSREVKSLLLEGRNLP